MCQEASFEGFVTVEREKEVTRTLLMFWQPNGQVCYDSPLRWSFFFFRWTFAVEFIFFSVDFSGRVYFFLTWVRSDLLKNKSHSEWRTTAARRHLGTARPSATYQRRTAPSRTKRRPRRRAHSPRL